MQAELTQRAKRPLWLAQLHNWRYWHSAEHCAVTTSAVRDRALMSPGLRHYLLDDPLYAFPRTVWDQLTDV
jgi:hypothetical protein